MRRITGLMIAAVIVLSCAPALAGKPQPDLADVAYGPHKRDVMDVWLADTAGPAPLVIYIHGGGFIQGHKGHVPSRDIGKCIDAGVSIASINYPYYEDTPLLEILRDHIARSVQYARSMAGEWNIDGGRVAVYGQSAGAGSSLWVAFHDDLADPDSDDAVLRESSRVAAAGAYMTQATYDLPRWRQVFKGAVSPAVMAGWEMIMRQTMLDMYHLESEKELKSKEFRSVRRELDMISMMDPSDPPVILVTYKSRLQGGENGDILHHEQHPRTVMRFCEKRKMDCTMILDETPEEQRIEIIDFLLDKLK